MGIKLEMFKRFALAGFAIFTVSWKHSKKKKYHTFKCVCTPRHPESKQEHGWDLYALGGQDVHAWFIDHEGPWVYCGEFYWEGDKFMWQPSLEVDYSSDTFKVWKWLFDRWWTLQQFENTVTIENHGRCGKCGRMLTTPESIRTGFGPVCLKKIMAMP